MNETYKIETFISEKYKNNPSNIEPIKAHIIELWSRFRPLADNHFLQEFTSGDLFKFQQRYWEMLVCNHLIKCGYRPESKDQGPDFKIQIDDKNIWVEAVAPEPCMTIKKFYDDQDKSNDAVWVPQDAFTLRITGCLTSADAQNGAKIQKIKTYIKDGVVKDNDRVVIAINTALLGPHGAIGKTGYPTALEAVYGIGNFYAIIDPNEGNVVKEGIQREPFIKNNNEANVEKTLFMNEEGECISALLLSGATPYDVISNTPSMDVIYNWRAKNELNRGCLGARQEYYVENDIIKIHEND